MRRLHLQPLATPSPSQLALLREAAHGPLTQYGRFWRRSFNGRRHAGITADSLVKRRLLAFEFGQLFITRAGRERLALMELRHAA